MCIKDSNDAILNWRHAHYNNVLTNQTVKCSITMFLNKQWLRDGLKTQLRKISKTWDKFIDNRLWAAAHTLHDLVNDKRLGACIVTLGGQLWHLYWNFHTKTLRNTATTVPNHNYAQNTALKSICYCTHHCIRQSYKLTSRHCVYTCTVVVT